MLPEFTLRLTTDVPVHFVRDGLPFILNHSVNLVLGVDESLTRSLTNYVQKTQKRTEEY